MVAGMIISLTQYPLIKHHWPKRSNIWILASSISWPAGVILTVIWYYIFGSFKDETSLIRITFMGSSISYSLITAWALHDLEFYNKSPHNTKITSQENICLHHVSCKDTILQENLDLSFLLLIHNLRPNLLLVDNQPLFLF